MKIIIQPKCGVELYNPNDEPIVVKTSRVVVKPSHVNSNVISIAPDKGPGSEVIWLKP